MIDWGFDVAGDFDLADGGEPVTLRRALPGGGFGPPVPLCRAYREASDFQTVLRLGAEVVVWHLDAAEVGPDGVTGGDSVEDSDGVAYDLQSAAKAGADDQWRAVTVRRVAGGTP